MPFKNERDKEKEKIKQDRYQIILTDLLKDEENKYCADCDAKGPRWASWNLGIFLCIRCAGIHRNLGCHVSRIKSINLDAWNAEQLQLLQEIGNSRARAIYEASVPDAFRRPQTDSSLETFIRAKYEAKKYLAKEWVPPTTEYIKNKAKEFEEQMERDIVKDKKKKRNILSMTNVQNPSTGKISSNSSMSSLTTPLSDIRSTLPKETGDTKSCTTTSQLNLSRCSKLNENRTDLLLNLDHPASHINNVPLDTYHFLNDAVKCPVYNGSSSHLLNDIVFGKESDKIVTDERQKSIPATTKEAIMALYSKPDADSFKDLSILSNNGFDNRNQFPPNSNNMFNNHLANLDQKNTNSYQYQPNNMTNHLNHTQNSTLQQDYLRKVQNQLASLSANNNARSTNQQSSILTQDSLI
ncbi:unnamed protein product [Gordionus sp. m RMFG-2023]|uniref:stromal membrane-associated protein 2-like n=1 Tax=Gordionus sp. m RMFG-2023 TaxID=3053472 RepID=UPI0030E07FA2